jgi:Mn-containing catalase
VYERLIDHTDDRGTIDTLQFLMTREITHMKAFMLALDSMGKDSLTIGKLPPSQLVNQYFNDSTGPGQFGDHDARGPWNQGDGWQFVNAPAFEELENAKQKTRRGHEPVGSRK